MKALKLASAVLCVLVSAFVFTTVVWANTTAVQRIDSLKILVFVALMYGGFVSLAYLLVGFCNWWKNEKGKNEPTDPRN